MTERGEIVQSDGRSVFGLNEELIEEREWPRSQHTDAEERENRLLVVRGNDEAKDRQLAKLRMLPDYDGDSLSIMDTDTASTKFQWMKFLPETSNAKVDGLRQDYEGCGYVSHGKNYHGLVEKSVPTENERMKNVPTESERMRNVPTESETMRSIPAYVRSVGTAEQHGPSRIVTGLPIKDGERFQVVEYPLPSHLAREMSRKVYEGSSIKFGPSNSPQLMDGEMARKHCEEGRCQGFHFDDCSRSLTPRSASSGPRTPFQGNLMENSQSLRHEALNRPIDGFGKIGDTQPARCEGYHHMPYSCVGANIHPMSSDTVILPRATAHSPIVGRPCYRIHPESRKFRKVCANALSEDDYHQTREMQNYNDQVDISGNNALDHTVHTIHGLGNIGNSHKHILVEDRRHSFAYAMQEEPALDNYVVSRPMNSLDYDRVMDSNPRDTYLEYGAKAIQSHESLHPDGDYDYETNHLMSYDNHNLYVSETEEEVLMLHETAQQRRESEGFAFHDQPERVLKRKHGCVGKLSRSKHRNSKGVMGYDNEQLTAETEEEFVLPVRSFNRHGQFQTRENVGVPESEPRLEFSGLSDALRSRLSNPPESRSRDIKKRLKHPHSYNCSSMPQPLKSWRKTAKQFVKSAAHVINTTYASQSYGNTKGTCLKKKFKTVPRIVTFEPAMQNLQVLHPDTNIEKQQKSSTTNSGSTKEMCHSREANPDHLQLKVKPADKDLPEDSEEFKREVDDFFFKSILHLNANSEQLKRFMEQGKPGCLRCIICSSSKQFLETKDVAMHAFTSPKVGLRAPHLGFHRALCVLMGWNSSAVAPNGRWICQSLPDAEAWALKEDIIVWPPVVIVHNYVGNYNLSDEAKLSIEHLQIILKDKGFDGGKTKVSHGRAGNPKTLVVKFTGTISGLQEAERLHNLFAEKKHGRKELQQAIAESSKSKDAPQLPVDKAEITLYGYLGIIEDLDKLHPDATSHFRAKSKKEILALANAAT